MSPLNPLECGLFPDLGDLFLVVLIMHILFMILISLGGIGLQEWAYTAVLGMLGVPATIGLSVALLFRVRTIVFGFIGGALYPLCTQAEARARDAFSQAILVSNGNEAETTC